MRCPTSCCASSTAQWRVRPPPALPASCRRAFANGQLSAGCKLPPTRALATALGIARNTVVHVYEQLALEGYVQAGVGRGTFVADIGPAPARHRCGTAPAACRRGAPCCRDAAAASSTRPRPRALQWGAFTPGVPEVRLFPAQLWSRLHSRLWRGITPQLMTYATGAGDAGLRTAIAEYLHGTRGVSCTPEQVVITSGTQQSLHLVAQLLADPGDAVWLEDPGYWGARSVFRATGLKLVPVPVDGEGLAPDAEPAAASRRGRCSCRRRTSTRPVH